MTSCDDQENKVTYSGPAEVSFTTIEGTSIFGEAPVGGVDKTYNIEVGVTVASDVDRVVTLEVIAPENYKGEYDAATAYAKGDIMMLSNTTYIANDNIAAGTPPSIGVSGATWAKAGVAIEGHHYNLTKTVTIPKGELIGNCVVTPVFSNLVSSFMDIKLKIKSIEGADVANYRNVIINKLIKFIPFDEAKVLGTYVSDEYGYDVEVVKADKAGEYLLKGEAKSGDIRFKFVYSNPADFHTVVLPETDGVIWYTSSKYGDVSIETTGSKGNFSMVGPNFGVTFKANVSAGTFGEVSANFTKK